MLLKDISLHRHLSITIQGEDDVFATVQTIDFDFWTKVFLKHFCCRDRNNISPSVKYFERADKGNGGKIEV